MYTRRFEKPPTPQEESETDIFRLPEHYAGNTFRQETATATEQAKSAAEETAQVLSGSESLFSSLGAMSPDLLLILLAFLLMGEENGDDISAILLFLLLV